MRKCAIVLAAALASCRSMPEEHEIRGYSREELEAPPSYSQMMGAFLYDVRVNRELDKRLGEGSPVCAGIYFDGGIARCVNDREEMEFYVFPDKMEDPLHRVEESIHYCRKDGIYYYHYVGGPKNLNVWLGPFRLRRDPRKLDEQR